MKPGIAFLALVLAPLGLPAATSAEFRAHVGVYGWADMPPSAEPLIDWVGRMESLGLETVRLAISPCFWDPRGMDQPQLPLDQLALRPDYATVFASAQFHTIILTAYPLSACGPDKAIVYRAPMTADQLRAVHDEMYNFALTLRRQWPGKTYVISNWESEHDAYDAGTWDIFLAYTQAWVSAVKEAGLAAGQQGYAGSTYSQFEFVNLDDATGIAAHDAGVLVAPLSGLRRGLRDLRDVDFWSYSSWNSVFYVGDDGTYNRDAFHQAFASIRASCQEFGQDCAGRIVIGELGFLWNLDDEHGSILAAILQTCLEEGARYVISWVSYDQPGELVEANGVVYDVSRFGKFDHDGNITPQGMAFRAWTVFGLPPDSPKLGPRARKVALH